MECLACVEWPRGILGMRHTRREPPTPQLVPPTTYRCSPILQTPLRSPWQPSAAPADIWISSPQHLIFLRYNTQYFFSCICVSMFCICIVFRVLMLHHVADGSVRVSCHHGRVEDGGLAEASHGRPPHALRPPPPRPGHDEGQRQRGGGAQEPHESRDHVLHHHQHGQ